MDSRSVLWVKDWMWKCCFLDLYITVLRHLCVFSGFRLNVAAIYVNSLCYTKYSGARDETSHTHWGNWENTFLCTGVSPTESPPKAEPQPWPQPPFVARVVGDWETKEKRGGGTCQWCYSGSWWPQDASKITEAKSMPGLYQPRTSGWPLLP